MIYYPHLIGPERHRMALSLRVSGATWAQIARAMRSANSSWLRIHPSRAKALVQSAERRLENARAREAIDERKHLRDLVWMAKRIRSTA